MNATEALAGPSMDRICLGTLAILTEDKAGKLTEDIFPSLSVTGNLEISALSIFRFESGRGV